MLKIKTKQRQELKNRRKIKYLTISNQSGNYILKDFKLVGKHLKSRKFKRDLNNTVFSCSIDFPTS